MNATYVCVCVLREQEEEREEGKEKKAKERRGKDCKSTDVRKIHKENSRTVLRLLVPDFHIYLIL